MKRTRSLSSNGSVPSGKDVKALKIKALKTKDLKIEALKWKP